MTLIKDNIESQIRKIESNFGELILKFTGKYLQYVANDDSAYELGTTALDNSYEIITGSAPLLVGCNFGIDLKNDPMTYINFFEIHEEHEGNLFTIRKRVDSLRIQRRSDRFSSFLGDCETDLGEVYESTFSLVASNGTSRRVIEAKVVYQAVRNLPFDNMEKAVKAMLEISEPKN